MNIPENPRIYVRRGDRMYRITIQRDTVWIERQIPRTFAGNCPMATDPDDLWNGNSWNLDVIDTAITAYEKAKAE